MRRESEKRENIRLLSGWREFQNGNMKNEIASNELLLLTHFQARFRFASNFESVSSRGHTDRTLKGYASGTRLLLAFSAAELIAKALDEKAHNWLLSDLKLANAVRSNITFSDKLLQSGLRKQVIKKLETFLASSDDPNIMVPAHALRIMFAHGTFTPTAIVKGKKSNISIVNSLADDVLLGSEVRFMTYIQGQHSQSMRPVAE